MNDVEMKAPESKARAFAAGILGAEPTGLEHPFVVLASPGWRGVESNIWRAQTEEQSVIVKRYHEDVDFYVDVAASCAAAGEAGRLNLGPKVLRHAADDRIIVMEDLGTAWRAGGLHDAYNRKIREKVIALKIAFQKSARLERTASIFDEIERLYALASKHGASTHNDILVFIDFIRDAADVIRANGYDQKPSHRDGNTANIMVSNTGDVRLVDFDLAANCDPFEDFGCFLREYFDNDLDSRSGFEEWHGRFDEGLFQRAMLYGIADDLRWGLIASLMNATSPRRSLEYAKYASWRYLRLETQIKRSEAADRIRKAS